MGLICVVPLSIPGPTKQRSVPKALFAPPHEDFIYQMYTIVEYYLTDLCHLRLYLNALNFCKHNINN